VQRAILHVVELSNRVLVSSSSPSLQLGRSPAACDWAAVRSSRSWWQANALGTRVESPKVCAPTAPAAAPDARLPRAGHLPTTPRWRRQSVPWADSRLVGRSASTPYEASVIDEVLVSTRDLRRCTGPGPSWRRPRPAHNHPMQIGILMWITGRAEVGLAVFHLSDWPSVGFDVIMRLRVEVTVRSSRYLDIFYLIWDVSSTSPSYSQLITTTLAVASVVRRWSSLTS